MTKESEVLRKAAAKHEQDVKDGIKPDDKNIKPGDKPGDKPEVKPGDKPGEVKPGENQLLELTDESVFKYLSEKQGREILSEDDLFVDREVEKLVETPIDYANEQVGAIDKFVKETGRDPEDYFKFQKDWTKVEDDVVLREYLKTQKPGLDDSDVNTLIDIRYKPEEKKDDDGNILNQRDIDLANLERKDQIGAGRQFFETEKSKYSAPLDTRKTQVQENWNTDVDALLNTEKIEIKVGEQSHTLTDKAVLSRRYKSIDSVLKDKAFAKGDGSFDTTKFISIMEKGFNAEAIVKNALTDAETRIREEVLGELPEPGNKPGEHQAKPGENLPGMKAGQKEQLLDMHKRIAER